ncbi:hypothetical protein [Neorhodopirellula pilleata]|uniref:Transmembrane protein n=1 Tax=Neorhodopirellula pilleata TaxID=2714738 RepID=A0A5C6ASG8_9BACT|nr:hypothetical protein [Neorhodopirellula pilleata]TWU02016.1 hypothetical protein Pla100_17520 [Neorhodopirellula pilleata]
MTEPADTPRDDTVRKGSPFAQSMPAGETLGNAVQADATIAFRAVEIRANDVLDPEWGVLRSAIWASAWVAIFSLACYQYFPGGGVLVTALGCALAIVGLFSSRPIPASVLLIAHAGLFFACYQRLF